MRLIGIDVIANEAIQSQTIDLSLDRHGGRGRLAMTARPNDRA
jgi:hypothetical protein